MQEFILYAWRCTVIWCWCGFRRISLGDIFRGHFWGNTMWWPMLSLSLSRGNYLHIVMNLTLEQSATGIYTLRFVLTGYWILVVTCHTDLRKNAVAKPLTCPACNGTRATVSLRDLKIQQTFAILACCSTVSQGRLSLNATRSLGPIPKSKKRLSVRMMPSKVYHLIDMLRTQRMWGTQV